MKSAVHRLALFAAICLAGSGDARPLAADVVERDVLLTGTGDVCDHSMEQKKVKLHKNENRKKEKRDVLVWQVINDCEKRQMVALCVTDNVLDACASLPRGLNADVNVPFPVEAGERVSLACRGATPGTRVVTLKAGDDARCGGIGVLHHVIAIEVVP